MEWRELDPKRKIKYVALVIFLTAIVSSAMLVIYYGIYQWGYHAAR